MNISRSLPALTFVSLLAFPTVLRAQAASPDLGAAYADASEKLDAAAEPPVTAARRRQVLIDTYVWPDGPRNQARYDFALIRSGPEDAGGELEALIAQFQRLALESYAPLDRYCRDHAGAFAYTSFESLYTGEIVFLKGVAGFAVDRSRENAGRGAANVFLFLPRLLKKGGAYAFYRADRALTGYETFRGVPGSVRLSEPLRPSYRVDIEPSGWQHFGWLKGDAVKTIYVRADEAGIKEALIGHFRKGACYGQSPDRSQLGW